MRHPESRQCDAADNRFAHRHALLRNGTTKRRGCVKRMASAAFDKRVTSTYTQSLRQIDSFQFAALQQLQQV